MIVFTRVDLPAPLDPTMDTTSALVTVSDMAQRACASP